MTDEPPAEGPPPVTHADLNRLGLAFNNHVNAVLGGVGLVAHAALALLLEKKIATKGEIREVLADVLARLTDPPAMSVAVVEEAMALFAEEDAPPAPRASHLRLVVESPPSSPPPAPEKP